MITELRIGNFKAFGETQRIPIRPITLVFGPNSSGKSSIIHALALTHEAILRASFDDIRRTKIGGTSIDLGGFAQYVRRHDTHRTVEWGATFDKKSTLRNPFFWFAGRETGVKATIRVGMLPSSARPGVLTYEIGTGLVPMLIFKQENDRFTLKHWHHRHAYFWINPLDSAKKREVFDWLEHNYPNQSEAGRVEPNPGLSPTSSPELPDLAQRMLNHDLSRYARRFVPALQKTTIADLVEGERLGASRLLPVCLEFRHGQRSNEFAEFMNRVVKLINELLEDVYHALQGEMARLEYLGPLRWYPARFTSPDELDDPSWHGGGGAAWDTLVEDEAVRAKINDWLGSSDRLKTPYEVLVRRFFPLDMPKASSNQGGRIGKKRREEIAERAKSGSERGFVERFRNGAVTRDPGCLTQVALVDRLSKTVVGHRDVGIGVSQVLPILVHAFGSKNRLIAIEQPEIHLHPALQADLADVLLASAVGDQKNTFLIETHSEHLILRILRRIRETSEDRVRKGLPPVKPTDIAVLYVSPGKNGARVAEIPVTPEGEFAERWPDGFFPERAEELFG